MATKKEKSFLEFVASRGQWSLEDGERSRDPEVFKYVRDNQYVWKPDSPKSKEYDFSAFFPIDNGGEPPYFRKRSEVDRKEAFLFALYKAKGGAGDFEPIPLPTPEELKKDQSDE